LKAVEAAEEGGIVYLNCNWNQETN